MGLKVTNNAFGTLNAGINSSATTIVLTAGQGARFPTLSAGDYFYATLIDTSNNLEIVKVTARSTDTMTVVRGQDNTTARAYSTNDRFELRPTAALFNEKANDDEVVKKSGSTMTGDLVLSGAMLKRTMTADGVVVQIKGSYPGNPNLIELAQTSSDGIIYVRDAAGNTSQIHSWDGGTSIIRGRVTHPNQPAFEVKISSSITPTTSFTTIVFNTAVRNQGGNYSTSTGVFTAPVSGVYHFSFNALYYPTTEGALVDLQWIKNGASVVEFQCSAPAGSPTPGCR
jgi:hypothetical protein